MSENIHRLHAEPEFRTPPANVDAERALLGHILHDNRVFDWVVDFLRPEHFTEPAAARIYEAISKLIRAGMVANVTTLKSFIERDEIVAAMGGPKYLGKLATSVVTHFNAKNYGELIVNLYLCRHLIEIGQSIVDRAYGADPDDTASAQMEAAEERMFAIGNAMVRRNTLIGISGAADAAIEMAEQAHRSGGALVGTTTGLSDLNAKIGGLHPSDLIILAGRPSMGKTALATTMAYNAAKHFHSSDRPEDKGKQVVFFSIEMSHEQLATRILAHLAEVDSHRIRTGRLTNLEFARLLEAKESLRDLPLHIDDAPAATVAAIRTRSRRLARRRGSTGLGLVVVDYLQLIGTPQGERRDNRVQELGAITSGLKAMAKDLQVPVLALSQLSRAVEAREDKRPHLADLRESGTIEQDSDVVMFAFREQYYLERAEPKQRPDESETAFRTRFSTWEGMCAKAHNTAEIIIGKQRHGPIGTVTAHFDGPTTWFSDIAKNESAQPYIQGME